MATLNRDMSDLRMLPKETVSDYFSRAINLGLMLKGAGKEMTEKDIILQLLTGMPDEYDTVRSILLTNKTDTDFTHENVQALMLQVEHRIQKMSFPGSTPLALNTHVRRVRFGQRPEYRSHEHDNSETDKHKGDRVSMKTQCYRCKGFGHLARDCATPSDDESDGDTKSYNAFASVCVVPY